MRDEYETLRIVGSVDPETFLQSAKMQFVPRTSRAYYYGFGGAGLFHDGHLVGIILSSHSDGWLEAVSMVGVVERLGRADSLGTGFSGSQKIFDLSPPETRLPAAISDLAKADPANIQEVAASQLALTNLYYENVLSQARRSFNAATVAAIVGLAFFLAAIAFAVTTDKSTAPLVSTLGGAIVEVVAGLNFWLYARTATQLNSFHVRLERMQRFLVANSVASALDGELKANAISDLVKAISSVDPEPAA
jgi:hypothetical protein